MLFTKLQQEEIKKGKKFGLLKEEIKLYAKPYFNAKQMKELRLGLEQGQGVRTVKTYAHFYLSYSEMAFRRQRYNDKEKMDSLYEDKNKHGRLIFFTFVTVILFFFAVFIFIYAFFNKEPLLVLKEDEIYVKCGEKVDLNSYIQEIDDEAIITSDLNYQPRIPGTYLYVYHVKKNDQEIMKTLRINVTDNQPPEIILTNEKIEIEDVNEFHCQEYVESVKDNVSSEKLSVGCSDFLDPSLEEQDVLYSTSDTNGNTGYAKLTVVIKQEELS